MASERLIFRVDELAQRLGVSTQTIRRWEKAGDFPQAIRLGQSARSSIGWKAQDVAEWIDSRPAA